MKSVEIVYKGKLLEKKYQPDFICFDEVIVFITINLRKSAQSVDYEFKGAFFASLR